MKKHIFSIILSLALFFFFAGALTFAQNKPEKKITKTEKQVEQKIEKKDVNMTRDNKSTDLKKKEMTMAPKETKNMVTEKKHPQKHVTATKKDEKTTTKKDEKTPLKEDANKKIK